ncbi:AGL081Wp [Eremothecium gossypii ATCC 10895]|uniref:AGL081Wp n=1 Tax=Eremothecium gossypii (strain ATCC 10895 / CBS 109.51 / FGSC 9923 / NRRL Y-1056) TaxID=284811 RepID=Q751A5_EREGS|nr:AGL081Wp [Eremothecium gossypii ATCC 10895]AAS54409.1 AGL081Wp [Eremothecium gossypii ATCC 10895]AEY98737.1 FAGL081Wp [Eremothecium gossypii FDAG1]
MDGLLINTEDIYTVAISKLLAQFDKGPLTWDVKIRLQGLPGREAAQKLIDHYDLPLTWEEVEKRNIALQDGLWKDSALLPGVGKLINYLKARDIPIAVCTSSSRLKFEGKTAHLRDVFDKFDIVVTGDDERIPQGRGKPFPDIWQLGLKLLNDNFGASILPAECLVFEDGIPGVESGKAFGAYVVWVPHPESLSVTGDTSAVISGKGEMLRSLEHFKPAEFGL